MNGLRGKSAVAFGPGLKPMSAKCLDGLDKRRARLLIKCGYRTIQLPTGEVVELEGLTR